MSVHSCNYGCWCQVFEIHVCLACGAYERDDSDLRALPCKTGSNHGPTKRLVVSSQQEQA